MTASPEHRAPRLRYAVASAAMMLAVALHAFAPAQAAGDAEEPDGMPLEGASWIWYSEDWQRDDAGRCCFRKILNLESAPKTAALYLTVDNGYRAWVNGKLVGAEMGADAAYWRSIERFNVADLLVKGDNVIAVYGQTLGGGAGLAAAGWCAIPGGETVRFQSDASWRVQRTEDVEGEEWREAGYDDSAWKPATVLHPMGEGLWGEMTYPDPVSPAAGAAPTFHEPGADYDWPEAVVFLAEQMPLRGAIPEQQTDASPKVSAPFGPEWVSGTRGYYELDQMSPTALGRRLCIISPARPDAKPRVLLDAGGGLVGKASVTWDGDGILFCMAPEGEAFFHVYRVDPDGSNPTRLTEGPFHDYDPFELPDGRIAFTSTRIGCREEYHGNPASSLFTLDPATGRIEPLTYHIVGDHEGAVTTDGGIAFLRRDIAMERAKVEVRVEKTRLDGSAAQIVLGAERNAIGYGPYDAAENNTAWLRVFGYGSPAPLPDGRVAAVSPAGLVVSGSLDRGLHAEERLVEGFRPYDVSAMPDGRLLCTGQGLGWLCILEPDENRVILLHDDVSVLAPVFAGPRRRPPQRPSVVNAEMARSIQKTGRLYCQNVFNTKQTNADVSRIRAIRVLEGRPFGLRSVHHTLVHIGVEAVELGTAPLAPDGSFFIEVPADRALLLQAVDGEGRAVINEMSWQYVRPGETRTCVGCHNPRAETPRTDDGPLLAATREPLALTGQGTPLRFRGNNAANGGVLNLQLDRFREAASIDLYAMDAVASRRALEIGGRQAEIETLCDILENGPEDEKISAAQRLGVLRMWDPRAIRTLGAAMHSGATPELRAAAALSLGASGNQTALPDLVKALQNPNALVAQAAHVALENITGRRADFDPWSAPPSEKILSAWQFAAEPDCEADARDLAARLAAPDSAEALAALQSLGHLDSEPAREALRRYLAQNPEAPLRHMMAAMRSLGMQKDQAAVALLTEILRDNAWRDPGPAEDLQELGWLQRPVYLAATAAEALGRIDCPESRDALVDVWPRLRPFHEYTWLTGDHDWLRSCHSSVIHHRFVEAFDALAITSADRLTTTLLHAIPIDPDRALLTECDSYETLTARVVRRIGATDAVLDACFAVLGEPGAAAPPEALREAVSASPPAREVRPHDAPTRAAQIASIVCADASSAPRLMAVLERYRKTPPSRTRSWVCFFMARALGKLRSPEAFDLLVDCLESDPPEAHAGFVTPPHCFIYRAITPFHRAAAATALGRIGDPRAADVLLKLCADLDNASGVRQEAARALGAVLPPERLEELRALAEDYPEVMARRRLLEACEQVKARRSARVAVR